LPYLNHGKVLLVKFGKVQSRKILTR